MKSDMKNTMPTEAEALPFVQELKAGSQVLTWGAPNEGGNLFYQCPPETWDGIWVNLSLSYYASEPVQRMIAIFFRGLKPGGILGWVAYEGHGIVGSPGDVTKPLYLMQENQYCSMLEQTGFKIKKVGHQSGDPLSKVLFIAYRV